MRSVPARSLFTDVSFAMLLRREVLTCTFLVITFVEHFHEDCYVRYVHPYAASMCSYMSVIELWNFSVAMRDMHLAIVLLDWELKKSTHLFCYDAGCTLSRVWYVIFYTFRIYGNNIVVRSTARYVFGDLLTSMVSYLSDHARFSRKVFTSGYRSAGFTKIVFFFFVHRFWHDMECTITRLVCIYLCLLENLWYWYGYRFRCSRSMRL